jgi:hypothetical protein
VDPIAEPPENADDWSNEEWLEWLKATDSVEDASEVRDEPRSTAPPIVRSAGGQVLGQAMIGLANALYGPKDDNVAIVEEASEPEPDEPFTLHLDPDHPERSSVIFKPVSEASEEDGHREEGR